MPRHYLERYRAAIRAIARPGLRGGSIFERPGISIKLTALHPRFEYTRRRRVLLELIPELAALCSEARDAHLPVTIDAEESDRLDLMLDVFEALGEERALRGWDGLGLAVQAYQKRALAGDHLACRSGGTAEAHDSCAAGEGRLLGQRDQSAARNWACPIIPCSRGKLRHGYVLSRLRARAFGGA